MARQLADNLAVGTTAQSLRELRSRYVRTQRCGAAARLRAQLMATAFRREFEAAHSLATYDRPNRHTWRRSVVSHLV
jgi:hypothetical protein